MERLGLRHLHIVYDGGEIPPSCLDVDIRHLGSTVDQELARLAGATHGVVRRDQLFAVGLTAAEIRTRMGRGSLIRVYRGVYRVGHQAPIVEARYLAAVWACGEGALLCGLPAAFLLGLVGGRVAPPAEVVTRNQRRIDGVRVRRSRRLEHDAFVWHGVPVTSPARTMVDLASVLSLNALARAFHEAGIRYGTTPEHVEALLERRPSPGAAKLRAVVHGHEPVTLSALERRFLRLLRDNGLPLPETNRPADGRRVDCRWPEHRLTVELDGYRYHRSRHAWELDRRREREARARGDDFRRFTYRDVTEPYLLLAELKHVLC